MSCQSMAEILIELADSALHPRADLLTLEGASERTVSLSVSRVKLALGFIRLPKRTQLVAILEDWDLPRIVREVY